MASVKMGKFRELGDHTGSVKPPREDRVKMRPEKCTRVAAFVQCTLSLLCLHPLSSWSTHPSHLLIPSYPVGFSSGSSSSRTRTPSPHLHQSKVDVPSMLSLKPYPSSSTSYNCLYNLSLLSQKNPRSFFEASGKAFLALLEASEIAPFT